MGLNLIPNKIFTEVYASEFTSFNGWLKISLTDLIDVMEEKSGLQSKTCLSSRQNWQ